MTKIEEFLTKFDDQHLANLQCAAEDGRLRHADSCNCLLHHFNGEYSVTKWQSDIGPLAKEAEWEFLWLGRIDDGKGSGCYVSEISESKRRAAILPMIHAEWARRLTEELGRQLAELERQDEMDHLINKMEELAPVSPNLR